jgi:hypothetical protein
MPIVITAKHIQESLVTLYLRLNGYFTSGHIVHATPDDLATRQRTEIDVFGLRLPYSCEPETRNPPSKYLCVENGILDVIVGEVKSGRQAIQFNPGIRDTGNMVRVLRRAGFTDNDKFLYGIASELTKQLIPQPVNHPETRIEITLKPSDDILYPTRVRPVLFHLGRREPNRNQAWFVGYQEIMNFTWQCLRKEFQPESCQREYDYHLWGAVIESIVTYFKSENRYEPGTPQELIHELIG